MTGGLLDRFDDPRDRFDFSLWLPAPRIGYQAWKDPATGALKLTVRRQRVRREPYSGRNQVCYMGMPLLAWVTITRQQFDASTSWRVVVAQELRALRRWIRSQPLPP